MGIVTNQVTKNWYWTNSKSMTFHQDSNPRLMVKMLPEMKQSHHFFQRDTSTTPPQTSQAKISPAVLFIIIILAVIFFISGLLHLLVRFIIKQRSTTSSSYSQSNRYQENISTTDAYQRQLQQLFHLHDSGLDQAFIDALPVFQYKEIVGLKEPFDCAVCLCEFTEQDKLRLLPLCSHAFHIDCIDTWLLSNSTCPLCRGALYGPGLGFDNPVFEFDDLRECDDGVNVDHKTFEIEIVNEKKVFPVRLGKFRSANNNEGKCVVSEVKEKDVGETSSSNLDARRCFSMGSYQYIEADSTLQVALCPKRPPSNGGNGGELKIDKATEGYSGHFTSNVGDAEARKISVGNKKESLSVSKIWLWSKKGNFQHSSNVDFNGLPPIDMNLPWTRNHVT